MKFKSPLKITWIIAVILGALGYSPAAGSGCSRGGRIPDTLACCCLGLVSLGYCNQRTLGFSIFTSDQFSIFK